MLQWCRLFNQIQNLPAGHCVAGVQTVKVVSEPTCLALRYSGESCFSNVGIYLPALCYSGADCLSGVGTYLPGTMLQWCRLFKGCKNLPTGPVLKWCRLLKQCQNQPARHCVTVVKAGLAISEPTCRALCCSGAGC